MTCFRQVFRSAGDELHASTRGEARLGFGTPYHFAISKGVVAAAPDLVET